MVGDVPEEQGLLRERQQPLLHDGDGHHCRVVDVDEAPQVRSGGVDCRVQREPGHVHAVVRAAGVNDLTLDRSGHGLVMPR